MLYTFNSFDSASKTVFTDSFSIRHCLSTPVGPYVIGYALADHLHETSGYRNVYRVVAAWQVLEVTVVIIQTEDNRVLTVQLEH
jgi:hypothetical protein